MNETRFRRLVLAELAEDPDLLAQISTLWTNRQWVMLLGEAPLDDRVMATLDEESITFWWRSPAPIG